MPLTPARLLISLSMLFGTAAGTSAQEVAPEQKASPEPKASPLSFTLQARGEYAFDADLDEGDGSVSTTRLDEAFGIGYRATDRITLGLRLGAEYSFYDFDDFETVAGGGNPMDDAFMYSVTPTIAFKVNDDWTLIGGGIFRWAGESDADTGDAFTGGGLAAANYRVNDRLTIGFGFIVASRLEDGTIFIPALTIDWKINDRWSLSNEEKPGLALRYEATERLQLAVEAWYTTRDYRLDDDNPIPSGAMEDTSVPLAFSARWKALDKLTIIGRVGTNVYHTFEFRNDDGDEVTDTDVDPGLVLGLEAKVAF